MSTQTSPKRRVATYPHMSEDQLLACVLDLAKLRGWRCAHFRPALTAKGWRTPLSADAKGWPDLIMVREADLLAVELKSDTGRATPEQMSWLGALGDIALEACIWRPRDWHSGRIAAALR